MQGRSLVPLLKGQTPADWRKSFYYHYYEYPGPHSVARTTAWSPTATSWSTSTSRNGTTGSCSTCRRTRGNCKSVYGQPDYAPVQKELETELTRLRPELKVPAQDPPETIIRPGKASAKPKVKPKAKAKARTA